MKLSKQAHTALMMVLQKCIMEECDIRDLLNDLDFIVDDDEPEFLMVTNPPTFKLSSEMQEVVEEKAFKWVE